MRIPKILSRILLSLIIPVLATTSLFGIIDSAVASAAPVNLIANPLVETANPSNTTTPLDWQIGGWGTNTSSLTYLNSGYNGDTKSVSVNTTAYTSGDAKWYFNPVNITGGSEYTYSDDYQSSTASSVVVAFTMSGGSSQYVDIGDLAASPSWQPFTASFTAPTGAQTVTVYHLINSVGTLTTDNFSLTATSSVAAPQVSISAPIAGASVSGSSVPLTASASSSVGVASVQFQVDGVNVGSPVTASPYQYNWNSISATNGTHSVSAVVTDDQGNTASSTPVSINVNNPVVAGTNIIPNPSMNTVDPSNPSAPQDWSVSSWGTNTYSTSYLSSGATAGSRGVEINMSAYTSGDAKWIFTPQNVSQGTQYQFTDYYQSSVPTQVDAVYTMPDGSTEYDIIGLPYVSSGWSKFSTKFSVPYGAENVTIYHFIENVGTLAISNPTMTPYTPVGFNRPLVTLTFDDGYKSTYTNGLPLLKEYGLTSTQFIITDLLGQTEYMTKANVKTMSKDGEEIASHTVTHDDMTQETAAQVNTELTQSQSTLQTITGIKPTDMAYPYGLYNAAVMSATAGVYTAARGVETGLNSKDNYNPYDIKVEDVSDTTSTAQVTDWLNQAKATDTWLVLVYHSVDPDSATSFGGAEYNVTATQLNAQLAAVKASGLTVETMAQAVAEITPQI